MMKGMCYLALSSTNRGNGGSNGAKDYTEVVPDYLPAFPRLNRARGPEENHPIQVAANNGGQGRGNQGNQARGRAKHVWEPENSPGSKHCDGYDIKIASGQLVEIDKVIKGCKLEIEGHVFDIDLIPFGHGSIFDIDLIPFGHRSFDVIIGPLGYSLGSTTYFSITKGSDTNLSHPAKAETRGVTSWISSQHNGVNNRESLNA
ncbi:hypothetical protein Tco_0122285 [Tanacetum coccineum]